MNAPDRSKFIGDSRRVSGLTVEAVTRLYATGKTQSEIAAELGTSQRSVCLFMRRNSIAARVAAKRDQTGPKNAAWKGEAVKYKPAHNRVYAARGRSQNCEHCGTTDPDKHYDWANISGKYHDPDDYIRLCRSCHCKYDNLIKNLGEHANGPNNVRAR